MSKPSTGDPSRPRRRVPDRLERFVAGTDEDREECELCESVAATSVAYGIRVCPGCEETYLP